MIPKHFQLFRALFYALEEQKKDLPALPPLMYASVVLEGGIVAYETNLKDNYSIVIVAKKALKPGLFKEIDSYIESAEEIKQN